MEVVTIYLRTALFSFDKGGEESHVPRGAVVIDGKITERPPGCLTIEVTRLRDGAGRELEGSGAGKELQLPWSKVDHLEVHER